MVTIGESRSFEPVGGQSENNCSEMVVESSTEDNICEKDAKKLYSVKRARSLDDEQQSSLVRVTYRSLPRKSKKKLEELLVGWSEWHSQHFKNDTDEELESGEESYYPALHLGADTSSTPSFLSDVPLIKKQCKGLTGLDKELVPLYDRGYAAPLCSNNSGSESKRVLDPREDTRCFNCGSYSHSLNDCSKLRDNDAITKARKQHHAKKKGNGGPRIPTRYFQESPAGKYDGLKQGSLSVETRQLLGIGEQDPPPWHHRMRELGYRPGNTVVEAEVEQQPSGITIIMGDEMTEVENNVNIDSNISKTVKIKSDCFPGTNIPIAKHHVSENYVAPHPRGVDIPAEKPNYFPRSELYYKRQMPDPLWDDRNLRFYRSVGATFPLDSFCAKRDYGDARFFGRFGDNLPPDNPVRHYGDYSDARFPGRLRGSPPNFGLTRIIEKPGSQEALKLNLPHQNTSAVSTLATWLMVLLKISRPYMDRSPDRWGSCLSVDEGFSFHSPPDHLPPFSFSPPDDFPVFPTQQTYGRHYPHNGY